MNGINQSPREHLSARAVEIMIDGQQTDPSDAEIWKVLRMAAIDLGLEEYFRRYYQELIGVAAPAIRGSLTQDTRISLRSVLNCIESNHAHVRSSRIETAANDVLEIIKPWIMDDPNMAGIYTMLREALKP